MLGKTLANRYAIFLQYVRFELPRSDMLRSPPSQYRLLMRNQFNCDPSGARRTWYVLILIWILLSLTHFAFISRACLSSSSWCIIGYSEQQADNESNSSSNAVLINPYLTLFMIDHILRLHSRIFSVHFCHSKRGTGSCFSFQRDLRLDQTPFFLFSFLSDLFISFLYILNIYV